MNATLSPFELALSSPLQTSAGDITERAGWILRIGTDPVGFGEATPLPGFTESKAECETALESAVTHLERDDVPAAEEFVGGRPAARHALATALHDRSARKQDRPFYRELGGDDHVESLPVQATIGDGNPETTVAAARDAVSAGFRTLKLKVGAGELDRDVERVAGTRSAVGDDVTIRVDANGAWDRPTATRAIERFREEDVALVEQPLPPTDLEGHRELKGTIPIALDESLVVRSPEAVMAAESADALVLKPMALGGPDVARDIALQAQGHDLDVIVSNTIDGAVARTAAVHLAASLPERTVAGLATASMLATDIAPDPAPVVEGSIVVPQEPGLGITEVATDA